MKAQWTDFITLLWREAVLALAAPNPCRWPWRRPTAAVLLWAGADPGSVWVSGNPVQERHGVEVRHRHDRPAGGGGRRPHGATRTPGWRVLKALTPAQVEAAKALLPIIQVDVKDVPDVLYAEVLAEVDVTTAPGW